MTELTIQINSTEYIPTDKVFLSESLFEGNSNNLFFRIV